MTCITSRDKLPFAVTRFSTETYEQYQQFMSKSEKNSCVYNSPVKMKPSIQVNTPFCVLEMNNTTNQIVGASVVTNHPRMRQYKIYEEQNYNRYSFIGKYRVSRKELNESLPLHTLELLEFMLFKEKSHMKRGQGIQCISDDLFTKGRKYLNNNQICSENTMDTLQSDIEEQFLNVINAKRCLRNNDS